MFSVIIPLYNKQDSIKNTINSVLNQTFSDFEILIVNDGSTDDSLAVVKNFNDFRIKIIDKPNGGVSSARNKGIREASNEWVTFLDGDDLWKKNHLEEYNKVIVENNNLDWIFSGYTSKNIKKEYNFIYSKGGVLENIFVDLLKGIKIHTSTVCIRKSLFTKNEDLYFTEGINNSEDREVWYKLCCINQSPYYIDKSLSIYILDVLNSLTKSSSLKEKSYLGMKERIITSDIFKKVDSSNKKLLLLYISNFNLKAIKGEYIRYKVLDKNVEKKLNSWQFFLLKSTIKLPIFFKKIIIKLC